MSRLRRINPDTIHPPATYTHVVEVTAGKLAFISGQVAFDVEGKLVGEDDMGAQTEQVFKNLGAALAAVGADFSSVIKLNYYVTELSSIGKVREVRARYLPEPPASTFVAVVGLARPEFLIEVEAVAAIP